MATSPSNPADIQDRTKKGSGSDKPVHPSHQGGDAVQNAQEWGGGSKGSKGPITDADRQNENSSARS